MSDREKSYSSAKEARANQMYRQQPWLVGANFKSSNWIDELEMWQGDTFDAMENDQELNWREIGIRR
jgi:hypothetical protein